MSMTYAIRLRCDHPGCKADAYYDDTSDALLSNWCMLPGQWLCPQHSYEWRIAQTSEPTDEDLLA